jgi:hypothetical protein
MYEVQHWAVGYNEVGDAPNPDNIDHGVTVDEAVMIMAGHFYHFAHIAQTNDEARAFRKAGELYDGRLLRTGYDKLIEALERGARLHGPKGSPMGGGSLSHVTRGVEVWVVPCFAVECDQITEEGA